MDGWAESEVILSSLIGPFCTSPFSECVACVASVASVAEIDDKTETSSPVNPNPRSNRINGKDVSPSSKCVASVASVADIHATSPRQGINAGAQVELPLIPCAWCDYKHRIEFDLGNHLLANHRYELLKLPIGKGSMDNRIDYAVKMVKSRMAAQYNDDDENDSDDVE